MPWILAVNGFQAMLTVCCDSDLFEMDFIHTEVLYGPWSAKM